MYKETDTSDAELRKAVTSALKQVVKSLENEPSSIVLIGDVGDDAKETIDEITSWLFQRRQDDGGTDD